MSITQQYIKDIMITLNLYFKEVNFPLNYSNPFELIVATIISAQCSDKRVNQITKILFKKYKTIEDYANANTYEFIKCIQSAGLFTKKTKYIISTAKLITTRFDGHIPYTFKELLSLPGIGRKTANIILNKCFKIYEGIAVDTHVVRIANILDFTKHQNPIIVEKDLMAIIPKKYWNNFSFLIQNLGKTICKARNKNHLICPILQICKYYNRMQNLG